MTPSDPEDKLSRNAASVLALLRRSKRRLHKIEKLASQKKLSFRDAEAAVAELIDQGLVTRARKDRVGLADKLGLVTGTVRVQRSGKAVVIPDEPDIPIALGRGGLRPAMHGDRVLVEVDPVRRKGLQRGTIKKIVERRATEIVGVVHGEPGSDQVIVPADARFGDPAVVVEKSGELLPGHTVRARIVTYPTTARGAEVAVTAVLGPSGTLATEIESVRIAMGIEQDFSAAALAEADALSSPEDAGSEDRVDMTGVPLMTIDPADAKDFDDAVCVVERPDGFTLHVAIADVAAYVQPGTHLDEEAFERATSVYFPGRAVPMLPERISGDLASLRPGVPRLAVAVTLGFDTEGNVTDQLFSRALIKSSKRLTYEEAQAAIDSGDPELERMWKLADTLRQRRIKRGAIDLELAESTVVLDGEGEPTGVARRPRLNAHRLVEEFMLAANEAVARHLESIETPFLYRIHERPDPDDVSFLAARLSRMRLRLPNEGKNLRPKDLQAVIDAARGKPFARLANMLVLRTMKQARYHPFKDIHFGLASPAYAHFTSPIRRYPDLIVHRALCAAIAGDDARPAAASSEALLPAAEHCSDRERRAEAAEREAVKAASVLVMRAHIGEVFEGTVSGVERFGFFVELSGAGIDGIEGFVPVGRLNAYFEYVADRMELWSRSSPTAIGVGDRLKVRVVACELPERRIELAPETQ